MDTFTVNRDDNVALKFDGSLIADVNSRKDDATRWTEIRIYRTTAGQYVCEIVGASVEPGEVNRSKAFAVDNGAALRDRMQRRNSDNVVYLTHLALAALREAAAVDDTIAESLVEVVA